MPSTADRGAVRCYVLASTPLKEPGEALRLTVMTSWHRLQFNLARHGAAGNRAGRAREIGASKLALVLARERLPLARRSNLP